MFKKILSHYLLPKNRLGDKIYAFLAFVKRHYKIPLKQKLLNDLIYEIKTSDEILNPLRIYVADKKFLKLYVKETVGGQHNVETYSVLRAPSDIDSYTFPSECCIKPTHVSGAVIIRRNNCSINKNEIKSWSFIKSLIL